MKDIVKENKKILLLSIGLLLACIVGLYLTKSGGLLSMNTITNTDETKKTFSQPTQVMESGVDYKAILKTSAGNITIDLFENETPITVNSFLFLVGQKYYENMIFHRVIKNFVIQTGDPTGTGSGGPGYKIQDEITNRKFGPYLVGMANSGANTNGSQFFITSGNISSVNAEYMDGKYTIFGQVTEGFAVVDSIEKVETNNDDKPLNDVKLEAIQISEN